MQESETPATKGDLFAALGYVVYVVPELRIVIGRCLAEENDEFLSYVAMNMMSLHVRANPGLTEAYLGVLEEALERIAGHEIDVSFADLQSPLWSLVNHGLRPLLDPFDDDQVSEMWPLLGPHLVKIVNGTRDWRAGTE